MNFKILKVFFEQIQRVSILPIVGWKTYEHPHANIIRGRTTAGTVAIRAMAKFTILEQGQESSKDEWYAHCLYGENDREVTVIVHGQVLEHLRSMGVASFPVVVETALEAADEVDRDATQIVVFMGSPLLQKMMTRFSERPKGELL